MRYVIAALSLLTSFSWAQEPQLTHDSYVNTVYGHFLVNAQDLEMFLTDIDCQQIEAKSEIQEITKSKTDRDLLQACLEKMSDLKEAYIQGSSDLLTEAQRQQLHLANILLATSVVDQLCCILEPSSSLFTSAGNLRDLSCQTRDNAKTSLKSVNKIMKLTTLHLDELHKKIQTQTAGIEFISQTIQNNQQCIGHRIDIITLSLESIRRHVAREN